MGNGDKCLAHLYHKTMSPSRKRHPASHSDSFNKKNKLYLPNKEDDSKELAKKIKQPNSSGKVSKVPGKNQSKLTRNHPSKRPNSIEQSKAMVKNQSKITKNQQPSSKPLNQKNALYVSYAIPGQLTHHRSQNHQ